MPTVVGIFDSKKHAEDAVLGLVEAGFERFDVKLISDESGLAEHGLEDAEIECYTEGMRRGGTVVAVRCYSVGLERAAEVMRNLGAVDVSARPGEEKGRVQPFGTMTEKAGMWAMRAGETERERAEDVVGREKSEERLGEMDRVYGGGIPQKGEERTAKSQDRIQDSEFRTQKDKASE